MSARRAAQAVHDAMEHKHEHKRTHYLAEVIDIDPLTVEFSDSHDTIDTDEGLVLTQWVRKYMLDVGLEVGDDVLVDHRSSHWIVTDVLSDNEVV